MNQSMKRNINQSRIVKEMKECLHILQNWTTFDLLE